MLVTQIHFDPTQEDVDGKGWTLRSWVENPNSVGDGPEPVVTTNTYLTITAAQTAEKALFVADPEINTYLTAKAEEEVLADNAAAVATELASLKTAEGLS